MPLQKVTIQFVNLSNGGGNKWKEPFNQATFFNYDTTTAVTINQNQVLPKAKADSVTGEIYPTVFEISLNKDEYNDTYFTFDFHSSASPNLQCMYTQYANVQFDPS